MNEHDRQEALVATALRRLGREPVGDSVASRLLAGGLSGSSVHYLDLAGKGAVLKLTSPGENRQLMARARREHLFYRELSTRVPLSVPRVLGADFDEAEGAVMLLAAYEPSPPADQWTAHDYTQAAQQLGRFHATFWGQGAMTTLPGWLHARPQVTLSQCRDATKRWRALGERDDIHETLEPLERLVMRIPELDPRMVTMPATLCHGDCHAGNLLRNPAGEWVWADWQEVRLGPGVDDLAFFWQRAFASSDTLPPYDTLVRGYRAGLESVSGNLITQEQLEHNLAWSELRSWLVDWPRYLRFLSAAQIHRVLLRITALMNQNQVEIAGEC